MLEKRDEPEENGTTEDQEPGQSLVVLPPIRGPLGPLVNGVARIRAGVHTKLLFGFLTGAVLLLGMAILSMIVINRMDQRVDDLNHLHDELDRARQMEHLVTSQMHFRAMVLLTENNIFNQLIANSKISFQEHLDAVESASPERGEWVAQVKTENARFIALGQEVLGLYESGDIEGSLNIHLSEEHSVPHELEASMRVLEDDAIELMAEAQAAFRSDRQSLTTIVAAFSGVSLVLAMLLVLSHVWNQRDRGGAVWFGRHGC